MKLAEMVDDWLAHLVSVGAKVNTITAYEADLHRLEKDIGNRDVRRITEADLESYFGKLKETSKSVHTLARAISSVRSFFAWLEVEEYIKESPATDLKRPSIASTVSTRGPLVTRELIKSIDPRTAEKESERYQILVRDRALLIYLYVTDLPVVKAANALLSECAIDGLISIVNADGVTTQYSLTKTQNKHMREWLQVRYELHNLSESLFVSLARGSRKAAKLEHQRWSKIVQHYKRLADS